MTAEEQEFQDLAMVQAYLNGALGGIQMAQGVYQQLSRNANKLNAIAAAITAELEAVTADKIPPPPPPVEEDT